MSDTPIIQDEGKPIKGFHKFIPDPDKKIEGLEQTQRILKAVRKNQPVVTLEQAKEQADKVAMVSELTKLKADVVRLRNSLNGLRRGSGCFCDYHLQNLHTNACLDAARALEETKP